MITPVQWSLLWLQEIRYVWIGGVESVLGSQAAARAHLLRLCDSHNDLGFLGHVIIVCPALLGEEVDYSMRMSCVTLNDMLQNGW